MLNYKGIEVSGPQSNIREDWVQGMIADAKTWLDMHEKPNSSMHTYNQTALEVYQLIKVKYEDFTAGVG